MMFAIAHDGFVQTARYATIEEAKIQWKKDVQNRWLYEYDCSVYEVDEKGWAKRVVPYEEIRD
jgi:hypothetical protein